MSLKPFISGPIDFTSAQFAPPGTNTPPSNNGENPNNEAKVVDRLTGSVQSTGNTTSLFNAFYVFKYSGGVSTVSRALYTSLSENTTPNGDKPEVVSNPTASAIVQWSSKLSANKSPYGLDNSTYSWSDFLFCKYYGVIPNNRLLTLRKYPLGSQDNAAVKRGGTKVTNLPVAQAITWFGPGTPNSINDLWQNKWELAWKKGSTDAKNVQGNEIVNFSQSLNKLIPDTGNGFMKKAIENLSIQADAIAMLNGTSDIRKALISVGSAEIEKKMQEFQKQLYSDNGAFFNQILGPVNVKNQFLFRDRGLSNNAPDSTWEIVFEYRTDSYFGMNQRRVGLDIIANMLELTYSNGEWLESLNIYYKNLGITLDSHEQQSIEACMVNGNFDAIELAKAFYDIASTRVTQIVKSGINLAKDTGSAALAGLSSIFTGSGTDALLKSLDANNPSGSQYETLRNAIQVELTKALAQTFPGFVQQRANVSNVPTGNWHLTIGNPMNPIMRIGDLVVKSCVLEFGEDLGPDDFPIELKFKVTLAPTKPRDARDIRRIFNAGRTDYAENFMGHTADQSNTYGLINKIQSAASANDAAQLAKNINNTGVNHAETWLNARYGGVVDTTYLKSVYFYKPNVTEFDYKPKKS